MTASATSSSVSGAAPGAQSSQKGVSTAPGRAAWCGRRCRRGPAAPPPTSPSRPTSSPSRASPASPVRPATEPVQQQVAAGLLQRRERRADGVGGAEHVRQHHSLSTVPGRPRGSRAARQEAGVGEDDVELASTRRAPAATSACCCSHSGSRRSGRRARARGAAELGRELLQRRLRARRQHEPVAGSGGVAGGRGADAGRGAGDQEDGIGHLGLQGRGRLRDRSRSAARSAARTSAASWLFGLSPGFEAVRVDGRDDRRAAPSVAAGLR